MPVAIISGKASYEILNARVHAGLVGGLLCRVRGGWRGRRNGSRLGLAGPVEIRPAGLGLRTASGRDQNSKDQDGEEERNGGKKKWKVLSTEY